jgi:hypothetical protein
VFERLLQAIARAFGGAGIDYMIIGGQAGLLHGEPRPTKDIDITLGVDLDRLDDVLGASAWSRSSTRTSSRAGRWCCPLATPARRRLGRPRRLLRKTGRDRERDHEHEQAPARPRRTKRTNDEILGHDSPSQTCTADPPCCHGHRVSNKHSAEPTEPQKRAGDHPAIASPAPASYRPRESMSLTGSWRKIIIEI